MTATRSGYLLKEDHIGRKWNRRFFELTGVPGNAKLVYWKDASRSAPAVQVIISKESKLMHGAKKPRAGQWPFSLELLPAEHTKGWRHMTLSGASFDETIAWVIALEEQGVHSTFDRAVESFANASIRPLRLPSGVSAQPTVDQPVRPTRVQTLKRTASLEALLGGMGSQRRPINVSKPVQATHAHVRATYVSRSTNAAMATSLVASHRRTGDEGRRTHPEEEGTFLSNRLLGRLSADGKARLQHMLESDSALLLLEKALLHHVPHAPPVPTSSKSGSSSALGSSTRLMGSPYGSGTIAEDNLISASIASSGSEAKTAEGELPSAQPAMSTDGYAKCIVIGSPLMDLRTRAMTWVDGGQTTVGKFSASAGGSAANVAVTLAQLDVHALIVGRLGDDGMGQVIH